MLQYVVPAYLWNMNICQSTVNRSLGKGLCLLGLKQGKTFRTWSLHWKWNIKERKNRYKNEYQTIRKNEIQAGFAQKQGINVESWISLMYQIKSPQSLYYFMYNPILASKCWPKIAHHIPKQLKEYLPCPKNLTSIRHHENKNMVIDR